jgi:hypothetical protein
MLGGIFPRVLSASFAALLLVGVAWSGWGVPPSHPVHRSHRTETILPPGPGMLETAMVSRGELLREWATKRDKRVSSGLLSLPALLAGSLLWALFLGRLLLASGRTRRSIQGIARLCGARSPPLRLA